MKETFSLSAKEEILAVPYDSDCCKVAFLSAVIHSAGSLLIGGEGKFGILIKSSVKGLARKLDNYLNSLYQTNISIDKNEIKISGENVVNILTDCGIIKLGEQFMLVLGIDDQLIKNSCCGESYAAGAFVGCGSISNAKIGYHLEFAFESKNMADDLITLFSKVGILAKQTVRKSKHIVYLKDNEAIGDCLAYCGARQAVLKISGTFVKRQVSQQTNRRVNCDMANADRAVNAGVRQAELFSGILESLTDDKLKETAKARINNPQASYEQLAQMLQITKSGIKHRLKKLEEIAADDLVH